MSDRDILDISTGGDHFKPLGRHLPTISLRRRPSTPLVPPSTRLRDPFALDCSTAHLAAALYSLITGCSAPTWVKSKLVARLDADACSHTNIIAQTEQAESTATRGAAAGNQIRQARAPGLVQGLPQRLSFGQAHQSRIPENIPPVLPLWRPYILRRLCL